VGVCAVHLIDLYLICGARQDTGFLVPLLLLVFVFERLQYEPNESDSLKA
jgi:hypothetical protein